MEENKIYFFCNNHKNENYIELDTYFFYEKLNELFMEGPRKINSNDNCSIENNKLTQEKIAKFKLNIKQLYKFSNRFVLHLKKKLNKGLEDLKYFLRIYNDIKNYDESFGVRFMDELQFVHFHFLKKFTLLIYFNFIKRLIEEYQHSKDLDLKNKIIILKNLKYASKIMEELKPDKLILRIYKKRFNSKLIKNCNPIKIAKLKMLFNQKENSNYILINSNIQYKIVINRIIIEILFSSNIHCFKGKNYFFNFNDDAKKHTENKIIEKNKRYNYGLFLYEKNKTKILFKILLDTLNLNMNSLNFIDFYKSFESSTNNNQNLNLEFLAKQLFLFCSNENFISLFYESMIKMKDSIPPILNNLLSIYEKKGKYFSLGVFFLLLEEMKKYNFDEKIKEITVNIMKGKESVVNEYNLYSKDELNLEECKKCIKFDIDNYIKENNKFLRQFFIFYSGIFVYSFYDIFSQTFPDINKEKIFSDIFSNLKDLNKYLKDGMNNFISKYININISLNHTKSVYQNFLFILNLINKENEITLKDKIDRKFFENLNINEPLNLNDKLTWILYKEDLKSKPEKKYIKAILEGKINEKDKFNYDIFDCINNPKESDNIKYMKEEIFKSIFNNKNVLVILLDFDYLKKNKQKLEQIQDNISLIQKSLPSEFSHLDTYIQIENKIINYDVSFDLFTQELKNQKLIEVNASHEINKQKDKNELKALKLELNKEKEKNQKLERELIIEKNKNKGNKVQEQKVSSTETIKDKKIKELETKLSRFPFTLEEGEELMSIMFVSSEQKLYYSTICKNTDGFRKIEEELYKKFPQYFENDITFRLNGKKINRFKTLGENGIKNNDIIEMKEIK